MRLRIPLRPWPAAPPPPLQPSGARSEHRAQAPGVPPRGGQGACLPAHPTPGGRSPLQAARCFAAEAGRLHRGGGTGGWTLGAQAPGQSSSLRGSRGPGAWQGAGRAPHCDLSPAQRPGTCPRLTAREEHPRRCTHNCAHACSYTHTHAHRIHPHAHAHRSHTHTQALKHAPLVGRIPSSVSRWRPGQVTPGRQDREAP